MLLFFIFPLISSRGKKRFHIYGHLGFAVCVWFFGRGFFGGWEGDVLSVCLDFRF